MDVPEQGNRELRVQACGADFDYLLFAVVTALMGLGVILVFSAGIGVAGDGTYFLRRQLLWSALSFTAFLYCMFMDRSFLQQGVKLFVWLTVALLVVLLLPPLVEAGLVHPSRRWFRVGGYGFQPSELAKVALLLYLSSILAKKGEDIEDFYRGVLPPFLIVSLVAFLVFLEPDFSTAFILFFVSLIMFFIAGIRAFSLLALGVVSVPVLFLMVSGTGYRRERIIGFLNPWSDPTDKGYRIIQSFKSFALGGGAGVGLGRGAQKMGPLPIPHTDFIFAVAAEELGYVGVLCIVFLYMLLAYRGFAIARSQERPFEFYLAFGITSLVVWEAVLNIAVVTGMLPSTGISLPFLSYGGSSLLTKAMLMGILLNLSRTGGGGAARWEGAPPVPRDGAPGRRRGEQR
ncbi:MAG: putative lipid II flippase FtsW [Spirochaetota bacterium]